MIFLIKPFLQNTKNDLLVKIQKIRNNYFSKLTNEGKYYLEELINIFKPEVIASIARKGEQTLKELFPDKEIKYIRHPSYGGKMIF